MDALVIACVTRYHLNLLNNESAKSEKSRFDLQRKLRKTEKWTDKHGKEHDKFADFSKPWNTFTQDARANLESVVVSFKQNLRVINKAINKYEKIVDGKKVLVNQEGVNWAIRKPMHKDTVSGKVNLPFVKESKGKVLTATRKSIDTSFNLKTIETITDTGIQKILRNYLMQGKFEFVNFKGESDFDSNLAFTPEGIEDLNNNIRLYNEGKDHKPIYKARVFELGSKFCVGESGNKNQKFVEAAKGTNLFFAIYQDENGKRSYETIPLNIVIERQKQGLTSVPEVNDKGLQLLFHLSPNDLIYIPSDFELENNSIDSNSFKEPNKIFKIVSFTGNRLSVIPVNVANVIVNKVEFTQLNKLELTKEKETCIKLTIDRLGFINKLYVTF
jgi:CRISPR-associated endonuclease Csn1